VVDRPAPIGAGDSRSQMRGLILRCADSTDDVKKLFAKEIRPPIPASTGTVWMIQAVKARHGNRQGTSMIASRAQRT